MFAVVLVGGFGTRLRPLTNDVPKPMLPVIDRPMIVHLVDRLAAAGVSDVVLALGFKPEPFQAAFPDGAHGDVRVHYAVEPEPLDTGGAIAFAARAAGVEGTFLVANGDVVSDLDFGALVEAHRAFGAEATLHLTAVDDPSAFGVVETDADGAVLRFVEKPAPGETDSNLINAGTYVFEPSVLDHLPPLQRVSVERTVFPALVDAGRLYGMPSDDYWLDAGSPEQFLQANLDLVRGVRGDGVDGVHVDAVVHDDAIVIESVVGPGASVATGARVTDSVLLPGGVVEAGAVVDRSVVAGVVGSGSVVTACIIGADYSVAADTVVTAQRLPEPT
ncbi:MAG: NDP-sugar synthase [Ilumatobacteraceae bacterium]|nr:NDP-sugar synthase [Ilumatobacteraceae bacterium]